MYDLDVSYTFNFRKKNMESSIIFLRNDVLILIGKENKEAGAYSRVHISSDSLFSKILEKAFIV